MPFEFLDQEYDHEHEQEEGVNGGGFGGGFGWGGEAGFTLGLGLAHAQAQTQAQARNGGGHADASGSGSGLLARAQPQPQPQPRQHPYGALSPTVPNTTTTQHPTTPGIIVGNRSAEMQMERQMEQGMGMEFDMDVNARLDSGMERERETLPGTRSVPAPGPRGPARGPPGVISLQAISAVRGTGAGSGMARARARRARDKHPISSTRPLMISTSSVASAMSRILPPTPTPGGMHNAGSVPVAMTMGIPVRALPVAFNKAVGAAVERRGSVVSSGGSDGQCTPVGLLSPGVRQARLQEMSRLTQSKNGGGAHGDAEGGGVGVGDEADGEGEVVPVPVEVLGGEMWDQGDEFERDGGIISTGSPNDICATSNTSIVNVTPHINIKPPPSTFAIPRSLPMYSSTGFDVLGLLSRVVMRKHKRIDLGPVDMSCSFVVVDVRR